MTTCWKLTILLMLAPLCDAQVASADFIPLTSYVQPDNSSIGLGLHSAPLATIFELQIGSGGPCYTGFISLLYCGFGTSEGETGSFVFNQANAPGFDSITSTLTDGTDDYITFFFGLADSLSRNLLGGATTGGLESQVFGGLLTGRSIDYFRLRIDENFVQRDASSRMMSWSPNFTWEVWGTGDPLPPPMSPVPEPSSFVLGLSGVIILVLAGRRGLHRLLRHSSYPGGP
jgi:hypothetical protein